MGVGAISAFERVIALIFGVILARWLGVEGYGIYAFVMAPVSLLLIVVKLGLPDLIMRDVAASRGARNREDKSFVSLDTAVRMILIASLAVYAASAVLVFFVITDQSQAFAFYIGLLLLPFLALIDLQTYALRGLGKAVLAQYIAVLFPSILALLGMMLLVSFADTNPSFALAARLVAVLIALAITTRFLKANIAEGAEPKGKGLDGARALLHEGLPFLMIGGVAVIMSRTDVIMLGVLIDHRAVGIYNAATQAAMLVGLIMSTSNTIAAPEFSRIHASGDKVALERFAISTARAVVLLALPVTFIAIYWSQSILAAMFGDDFSAGALALAILSGGYFASLLFGAPGFVLNMTGHQTTSFRIALFASILNLLLNAILIPILGFLGAAMATAFAMNVQKFSMYIAVKKVHGISTACFGRRSDDEKKT